MYTSCCCRYNKTNIAKTSDKEADIWDRFHQDRMV